MSEDPTNILSGDQWPGLEPEAEETQPPSDDEVALVRAYILKKYFPETSDVVAGLATVTERVADRLSDGFQPIKDLPAFVGLFADDTVKEALRGIEEVKEELRAELPASAWARLLCLAAYDAAVTLEKQGK